jgi:hypothetical protein
MRPKFQKHSAQPKGHLRLKLDGRINETQILQTQCSNICKLNYPAEGGGYRRYPWYPKCKAFRD